MKASDYAARFLAEGRTVESLARIIIDMMNEVIEIMKTRRASNDSGLFSVLNEMDLKFDSFFRQTEGKLSDGLIHPRAFRRMVF